MSNSFIKSMQSHDALTDNGALTHSTSGKATLDLFFQIGAARGWSDDQLISAFTKALGEDPLTAMKMLFYNRDVRGGQGERRSFRVIASYLIKMHPDYIQKNMALIPEFGRFDDLFVFADTPLESAAFELYASALNAGNGLAAKWCYREKSSNGAIATKLRKFMGLSSKQYRQMLSRLTKVVETQMCNKEWSDINFSHVPSVAMKRYRKAFNRNAGESFSAYFDAIERGDPGVKINAEAIFPHDIILGWVKSGQYGTHYGMSTNMPERNVIRAADAQWNALPDYMGENSGKVLCMADVSGSMTGAYNMEGNGGVTPMDVSVALALYTAERAKGPFKDFFMTFSGAPDFVKIQGANIYEKIMNISKANWAMNTNLQMAFDKILSVAIKNGISQEEMPSVCLVISDMQFDSCASLTNMESIRAKYAETNLIPPQIIFWNVDAKSTNSPVKLNKQGVGLVSGLSPSILPMILSGECNPMAIMDRTLGSDRYAKVRV